MKSKQIITVLLLMFIVAACKDKEVQNETIGVDSVAEIKKENIIVTLSAVVKKDDSFQIYFKNEDSEAFTEEKSLYVEFKGNDNEQNIVFNLPEDEFPNYIRIDFGVNKEQDPIEIKNLTFNYFEKSFQIKGSDFTNYFYSNDFVEIKDKSSGIIKTIVGKDGNYDPMSASADGLRKQLEELIQ